jgi:beta-barrel assembly-enhancing protease
MLNALIASTFLAVPAFAPHDPLGCELIAYQQQQETAPKVQDPKHQKDIQNDIELGTKYSKEIEKELKFSKKQEYIDRVQRIGAELAAIAQVTHAKASWGDKRLSPFTYRFFVIENDSPNAFSIPGGFIYVHEGLLEFSESDDELAGVLAHEIAHASFRHLATLQREASKLQNITLPVILAAIVAGGKTGGDIAVGTQLYQQVKYSGWGEAAEMAADYGGLQYMVKSKYNPTGLLTFMERLAVRDRALEKGIDLGIFRTHPPSRKRAETLSKEIVAAGQKVRRSQVTTSFSTIIKPVGETVEAWFGGKKLYTFVGADARTRAETAAEKLNAFFDETPEMYEIAITQDGAVVGRGKVLFKISEDDAKAAKSDYGKLQSKTELALKRSVSYLSSMVWLAR